MNRRTVTPYRRPKIQKAFKNFDSGHNFEFPFFLLPWKPNFELIELLRGGEGVEINDRHGDHLFLSVRIGFEIIYVPEVNSIVALSARKTPILFFFFFSRASFKFSVIIFETGLNILKFFFSRFCHEIDAFLR